MEPKLTITSDFQKVSHFHTKTAFVIKKCTKNGQRQMSKVEKTIP